MAQGHFAYTEVNEYNLQRTKATLDSMDDAAKADNEFFKTHIGECNVRLINNRKKTHESQYLLPAL